MARRGVQRGIGTSSHPIRRLDWDSLGTKKLKMAATQTGLIPCVTLGTQGFEVVLTINHVLPHSFLTSINHTNLYLVLPILFTFFIGFKIGVRVHGP